MSHPKTYESELWDGIKVVYDKYEDGKRMLKEMLEFFKERAALEDNYAKGLTKIVKAIPARESDTRGTVNIAWTALRLQSEGVSKHFASTSLTLSQMIVTLLVNFKKEQHKTKKQLESEVLRLNKELEKSLTNLVKAKQKFHTTFKDAGTAKQVYEKSLNDGTQQKDIIKHKAKMETLQKSVELLDTQYKGFVKEHQIFQGKYEQEIKKILSQFQQLEEKRLAFVKEIMEKYIYVQDSLNNGLSQNLGSLKSKVAGVDWPSDVQLFLEEKKTNLRPPALVEYEHPTQGTMSLGGIRPSEPTPFRSNEKLPSFSNIPINRVDRPAQNSNQQIPPLSPQNSNQQIPIVRPLSPGPPGREPPGRPPRSNQEIEKMLKNTEEEIQGAITALKEGDSDEEKLVTKEKLSHSVILSATKVDDVGEAAIEEYQVKNVFKKSTLPPTSAPVKKFTVAPAPVNNSVGVYAKRSELKQSPSQPSPQLARAQFDYVTDEDDEISFKEGDIVKILKMEEHGWWTGEFNGKTGIFPGNFVELLQDNMRPAPSQATLRNLQNEKRCKVKFQFKATADDELSISEGELITIITEAEGWILGTNSKGQQGLFPANFVEVFK